MRAVAVLAVFADHLFGWPSGGFVGVDVFFVLSGFFITGLLIRERTTTGTLSFRDFYVRRVKRILPSAVLVLVATVLGSYLLFPAVRARETLIDALYAAIFAANYRFEAVGADYFQRDQPPSPLQHYWSLSIEEQFYFVWPALLMLLFAITRRIHRRGYTWARQSALFASMAAVVAASYGWAMFLSVNDPNVAYFSTWTRVWELGVGALVAIAGPWLANLPYAIRPVLAYVGLAGVIGSLFLIDSTVQFPAPWAALPVISTALVIVSFHGVPVRGMLLLTNPVVRYFGDTSYTLYLWHWPVLILLLTVVPKGPLFYASAVALALGLTAVTYHFYEDPIRKSGWLLDQPKLEDRRLPTLTPSAWALTGGLTVAVIVISILGFRHADMIAAARDGEYEAGSTYESSTPIPRKVDPCFGASAIVDSQCVLRDPDVPLQPSVDSFANDRRPGGAGCFRVEDAKLKSCTYGYRGDAATRIALVGDSHAGSILPALLPLLTPNKWQLTTYVGIGCQWQSPPHAECNGGELLSELAAHPYDLVLTTASRHSGAAAEDYRRAWAPIAAAGSRIVVLSAIPTVSEDSLACLTRVNIGGDGTGDCGTPRQEALAQPDALIEAAQLVTGTTVFDMSPFYCNAERCPTIIGNVIVYRDTGGHLTKTYAETLAPAVEDGIRRALGTAPPS